MVAYYVNKAFPQINTYTEPSNFNDKGSELRQFWLCVCTCKSPVTTKTLDEIKKQITPDDLSLITFSTQTISLRDVLFADYLIQYMFTCWSSGLSPVLKMFEKTNVLNYAP